MTRSKFILLLCLCFLVENCNKESKNKYFIRFDNIGHLEIGAFVNSDEGDNGIVTAISKDQEGYYIVEISMDKGVNVSKGSYFGISDDPRHANKRIYYTEIFGTAVRSFNPGDTIDSDPWKKWKSTDTTYFHKTYPNIDSARKDTVVQKLINELDKSIDAFQSTKQKP